MSPRTIRRLAESLYRRPVSDQLVSDYLTPPTDPVQLGHHAKQLLDDPVLNEALTRIKGKLATAFMGSAVGNTEGREAAYRLNWAVQELEKELRLMVGNAAVIEAQSKAPAR